MTSVLIDNFHCNIMEKVRGTCNLLLIIKFASQSARCSYFAIIIIMSTALSSLIAQLILSEFLLYLLTNGILIMKNM